ncbi:MAG: hypothetical protein WDZ72_08740, partial [Cyclobacteriaceae bacterium]
MKSSMTRTTHRGMIIIARFSRIKSGQAIPTFGTGQVMAAKINYKHMNSINLTHKSIIDIVHIRFWAYLDLLKFRLSALVTFSAVFGFILGHSSQSFSWGGLIGLIAGGFLI